MANKSPLALMKEAFGDKAKLVQAIEKLTGDELWVSRVNKNKGLAHVSNAKLLRLHATFAEVKEKFGTRVKLVDAILELDKRSKDVGLRDRLLDWPVPRLYDAYKSSAKRQAHATSTKSQKPRPKVDAVVAAKIPLSKKGSKADGSTKKAVKKAGSKKGAR